MSKSPITTLCEACLACSHIFDVDVDVVVPVFSCSLVAKQCGSVFYIVLVSARRFLFFGRWIGKNSPKITRNIDGVCFEVGTVCKLEKNARNVLKSSGTLSGTLLAKLCSGIDTVSTRSRVK
ncbi:AAEL002364-PA [Aedes aegypti]|uniref:AAEL002364-PA n=1 Tax=Aedes aegypti TaxID=7159 RepID=Q17IJ4_AEDAE|nr:AAEL002364-PA [Aedes aegypti]